MVPQQRARVHEGYVVCERAYRMREVAFARREDKEEGEGIEGEDGGEGVEGGEMRGYEDPLGGGEELRGECSACEDGDCGGENGYEGYRGEFVVCVEESGDC